jgi:hypothetical protein
VKAAAVPCWVRGKETGCKKTEKFDNDEHLCPPFRKIWLSTLLTKLLK